MLSTLKIDTSDLELGMFVSALDRPWLDTPFTIQGFRLQSREQIDSLRQHCEYVFIDTRKSRQKTALLERKVRSKGGPKSQQVLFQGRQLQRYTDQSSFSDERPLAERAVTAVSRDLVSIHRDIERSGTLDPIRLKRSVEPLITSISRNPDACLWVALLKQHDRHSYNKSLLTAILAVSLGREIGFPRHDLRSLAMGSLLIDIGKVRVEPKLLNTGRELTPGEQVLVQAHVEHGQQIAEASGIINRDVIDMICSHHERHDGSGYPRRLQGENIPLMARMAGLADTYTALTGDRPYARTLSPTEACRELYEMRGLAFQAVLVEAFIRALGVYPAGSLVELNSGQVAVVVAEGRKQRLQPTVLLLLDTRKRALSSQRLLDLENPQRSGVAQGLLIARSLPPGAYNIDLARLDLSAVI